MEQNDSPMDAGGAEPRPAVDFGRVELVRQQLAFYRALAEHSGELAAWYLGASVVLMAPANPERFAQGAHSIRELMNNLHTISNVPVQAKGGRLGDTFAAMTEKWEKAKRNSECFGEDGVWIGMHPAFSDVYMCALTAKLAATGGNVPITDEPLHHVAAAGWTVEDLSRALLPDAQLPAAAVGATDGGEYVVSLALKSFAVRNLADVPVERILKLRDDYHDEFLSFRAKLDQLVRGLSDLDDVTDPQALAHHIDVRYRDEVEADRRKLERELGRQRLDIISTAANFEVAGSGVAAVAALAALGASTVLTGGATAAAHSASRLEHRAQAQRPTDRDPRAPRQRLAAAGRGGPRPQPARRAAAPARAPLHRLKAPRPDSADDPKAGAPAPSEGTSTAGHHVVAGHHWHG